MAERPTMTEKFKERIQREDEAVGAINDYCNETPLTVADWRAWLRIPENRERYEAALKKWDERLRPLREANRRAQQITGDDLNIIVGPCR